MPNVVGPDCVDTVSIGAFCIYPAEPIGGETSTSSNVYFEGEKVEYYPVVENIILDAVDPSPIPPYTGECLPGDRRLNPTVNTSVHINGKLFAVSGDEATLVFGPSTPRPLTGPFKYPTIVIG